MAGTDGVPVWEDGRPELEMGESPPLQQRAGCFSKQWNSWMNMKPEAWRMLLILYHLQQQKEEVLYLASGPQEMKKMTKRS